MDYITKSISRKDIRTLSLWFRDLFIVSVSEPFPVVECLDKLHDIDIFSTTAIQIVHDNCLPYNIPTQCNILQEGFLIEIKESIYNNACKGVGACRMHILHELCHVFLFQIGYTPNVARCYENNRLPPYKSVEWQAKALCGEIMMPYEDTKNMAYQEIIDIYGVSPTAAKQRLKY